MSEGDSENDLLFTQLFPAAIADQLEENDAEDLQDLESHLASMEGQAKKGSRKLRGSRKSLLSDEQARMLGEANVAYTQGDYEEALDLLNEIIRVAPHANQAWFTLAMIHEELGDAAKALQTYLVAAHLTPKDNALWKKLGSMSARLGMFDQAIYCYGKALAVDRGDFEALWDRSSLYYEMGQKKRAIEGYKLLLKRNPNDMQVTKELARIYLNAGQPIKAIAMFEQAITADDDEIQQHLIRVEQLRGEELQTVQEPIRKVGYEELNMLAELYMEIDEYEKAIEVIRTGVRKVQGRMHETEWNDDVDDREFDPRIRNDPDAERRYLPMELRVRLGICYLWVNNHRVAKQHLSLLEDEDLDSFYDLFFQVGEAYFGNRMFDEALRIFLILEQHEPSNRPPLWKMMAKCYRAVDDLDSAIDRWKMVLEVEPSDIQAMTELADLYMERGEEALANPLLEEIEQAQSTLEPTPVGKPKPKAGLIFDRPKKKRRGEAASGTEESGIESDDDGKIMRRRRRRGGVTAEDLDLRYTENQELFAICKKVWDTLDHGKLVGPSSRLSYERILQAGRKLVNRFQASRTLAHRRLDRIRRSDVKLQLALAQFGDEDLKCTSIWVTNIQMMKPWRE